MQAVALTFAFLLELVAFISFAAISYVFTLPNILKLSLCIALLVALVIFWSMFMAPRASKKFHIIPYYISKLLIYTVSAATLFITKGVFIGGAFVALVLADEALLFRHNTAKD